MAQILEVQEKEIKKQEQKQLTFEDICPIWARRINAWLGLPPNARGKFLNTLNSDCQNCFLGEAWGWESLWGDCPECQEFGGCGAHYSLVDNVTQNRIYPNFYKNRDLFVAHWNECHRVINNGLDHGI